MTANVCTLFITARINNKISKMKINDNTRYEVEYLVSLTMFHFNSNPSAIT